MHPSDITFWYPSADLSADGDSLPQFTVESGSTTQTISWTDASGKDWSYAIGFFDSHTETTQLQNVVFSVSSSTASVLSLASILPTAPAAGDTFRLVRGLKFRSNVEIPLTKVNGRLPELEGGVELYAISGVSITRAYSESNLYIKFDANAETLAISTDNDTYGNVVSVSDSLGESFQRTLETGDGEFVVVNVETASLPSETTTELLLVSYSNLCWLPLVWIDSSNSGDVLCYSVILRNDSLLTIAVTLSESSASQSSSVSDYGDDYIDVADGSNLPYRDFWLYSDSEDIRYITRRTGNRCYVLDDEETSTLRGYTQLALSSWNGSDVFVYPDYDVLVYSPSSGSEFDEISIIDDSSDPSLDSPCWTLNSDGVTWDGPSISGMGYQDLRAIVVRRLLFSDMEGNEDISFDLSFA